MNPTILSICLLFKSNNSHFQICFVSRICFEILSLAWENGIRNFDTAPIYGWSEEILGEFVRANGISKEIRVSTKVSGIRNSHEFRYEISQSLQQSLDILGTDINVLFLHHPKDSILISRNYKPA